MSDKEQKRRALAEKRARALTRILLSRRPDLRVEEIEDEIGQDFVVRFRTQGKEGRRELGIEVKADWAALSKDQADQALRPVLQRLKRFGPFPHPLCLFYFTMENDGAWYTWIAEPLQSVDGRATLSFRDSPDCHALDKKALRDIIERVDKWYDVHFSFLLGNGPAGGKAHRKQVKQQSGS